MKAPKVDNSGVEMQQKAIADAQTAANNLRKNMSQDLATQNLTQVVPGGSALGVADTGASRKRRTGTGLASALGING